MPTAPRARQHEQRIDPSHLSLRLAEDIANQSRSEGTRIGFRPGGKIKRGIDGRGEERFLGAEVAIDQRGIHTHLRGDLAHADPLEAVLGEERARGSQDGIAGRLRIAWTGRTHGTVP
jgi:hypothetical protein